MFYRVDLENYENLFAGTLDRNGTPFENTFQSRSVRCLFPPLRFGPARGGPVAGKNNCPGFPFPETVEGNRSNLICCMILFLILLKINNFMNPKNDNRPIIGRSSDISLLKMNVSCNNHTAFSCFGNILLTKGVLLYVRENIRSMSGWLKSDLRY